MVSQSSRVSSTLLQGNSTDPVVFRAAHAHTTLAIKQIPHIGNKSNAQPSHNNSVCRIDQNRM